MSQINLYLISVYYESKFYMHLNSVENIHHLNIWPKGFDLANLSLELIYFLDKNRLNPWGAEFHLVSQAEFWITHADQATHERRRNKLEYCGCFSLIELREYVENKFQQNKNKIIKISTKSLHRLFTVPNKSFRSSEYYKEIFSEKRVKMYTCCNYIDYNVLHNVVYCST